MFFSYNIATLLIGFMSGLTLLLSSGTVNYWLAAEKIDITSIGLFSLISLPYAISFIWSPIFDQAKIPFLTRYFGHRFSWIIVAQMTLSLAVGALGKLSPNDDLIFFAMVAMLVAFLSSSQDVALGAFRAEIIPKQVQASTSGSYILGYRLGMLVSSSGAISASIYYSWEEIYGFFSVLILYFPIILFISTFPFRNISEPYEDKIERVMSLTFWKGALKNMGGKGLVLTILLFLILFRIPDNFISAMINPFLLKTGFDALEIATIGKTFGIIAAIIGGILASIFMRKMKILDAILLFGFLHAFTHLSFIWLNHTGDNIYVLSIVIGLESLSGGMVMATYIALINSLCKGKYSATQYALLTSMMGISRSIFPAASGYIVNFYGWDIFFIVITILTIPPLLIAYWLKGKV